MWSENRTRWPTSYPSMCFPHTTSNRFQYGWLHSSADLWRLRDPDYPAEAYFYNHTRAVRLPMPQILYFQPILAKYRLDNMTGICYQNSGSQLPQYYCCLISGPITYWDTLLRHTTLNFPLFRSWKGNSYQFNCSTVKCAPFAEPRIKPNIQNA